MECYWKTCQFAGKLAFRDVRLADGKYLGEVYLCSTHFANARRTKRLLIKDEILAQRLIHIKLTRN